MKKTLFILPAFLLLAFINPGNDITVKGSDTVLPLSQKTA
jgi:hypothetical protein